MRRAFVSDENVCLTICFEGANCYESNVPLASFNTAPLSLRLFSDIERSDAGATPIRPLVLG